MLKWNIKNFIFRRQRSFLTDDVSDVLLFRLLQASVINKTQIITQSRECNF